MNGNMHNHDCHHDFEAGNIFTGDVDPHFVDYADLLQQRSRPQRPTSSGGSIGGGFSSKKLIIALVIILAIGPLSFMAILGPAILKVIFTLIFGG